MLYARALYVGVHRRIRDAVERDAAAREVTETAHAGEGRERAGDAIGDRRAVPLGRRRHGRTGSGMGGRGGGKLGGSGHDGHGERRGATDVPRVRSNDLASLAAHAPGPDTFEVSWATAA